MPFQFQFDRHCPQCPFGHCLEDRRSRPVPGRKTEFRLKQSTAMNCTFGDFMPGTDNDPAPDRTFDEYLSQFRANVAGAGRLLFGESFSVNGPALAKVEGDVFELMEAGTIWNALAVWNHYMDSGMWESRVFQRPEASVRSPARKVAAVKLPRGYDATLLFREDVRATILSHEHALKAQGMSLGLSAPDIVGVRVPDPIPTAYEPFLKQLSGLGDVSRAILENGYKNIEGTLDGRAFLFAIAVKRTTRSDRLYQPLFEANVLKYLIQDVLRGAAFRFHVHMGSLEGADVEGHYSAASLLSLIRDRAPSRAVNVVHHAIRPSTTAQAVLDDLGQFPI